MYKVTIDADRKKVLSAIDTVATELSITWFLCGAYSRILLCEEVLKVSVGRATFDLDIAICVESLEDLDNFRDSLRKKHNFKQDRYNEHRLIHTSNLRLDIIPFGRFAEPDEMYRWGEEDGFEMNVQGFADAYSSSISLSINDEFEIKLAGFAEQFVLKLFAWKDRRSIRVVDDAGDLAYFLVNAIHSFPDIELYNKYDSVLEENEYDAELTSCFVLGKQIRSVFSEITCNTIHELLDDELQKAEDSALISDMYKKFTSWPQPEERISDLFKQLLNGIRD